MELVDSAIVDDTTHGKIAFLLLPFLSGGSLREHINRQLSGRRGALMPFLTLFPSAQIRNTIETRPELLLGQDLPWTEARILQLFAGVCLGVRELHHNSPPLAHRDIKPENVLLSDATKQVPVLIDFGSMAPAQKRVTNRSEALLVQDDASRNRCVEVE